MNKEDYGTGRGKEGRRMKNEKRNTKQREEGSMEEEEKANYKNVSKFAFPPSFRRTT